MWCMGKRRSQLARTRQRMQAQGSARAADRAAVAKVTRAALVGITRSDLDEMQQLRGPGAAPTEVILAQAEAGRLERDTPAIAEQIAEMPDNEILLTVMGIAYAAELGHTETQCRERAAVIRLWTIFNGVSYLYQWPTEVAAMSDDEIIAACRADRASGYLPLKVSDVEEE